jgi:hypothetical protein
MGKVYATLGGRKMSFGLLVLALFTLYAWAHDATFLEYAGAVGGLYGFLATAIAWEDNTRIKHGSSQ